MAVPGGSIYGADKIADMALKQSYMRRNNNGIDTPRRSAETYVQNRRK